MSAREWRMAGAAAIFLLGLYLATFSGRFHSSDGFSMYAAADSLVRYGQVDTEQIRWMGLQQGIYGPDGRLYSRKGGATTFLAIPLVWLGMVLPDIGPVHAALLLTPILTALTGLYLYLTARRAFRHVLPPAEVAPLAVTLVWGLGSMAWPYAKTFFSEPVVALSLMAAAYHLVGFRDRGGVGGSRALATRHALLAGAWLGIGVLARVANAMTVPLYGLALLWYLLQGRGLGRRSLRELVAAGWRPMVAFGAPLVVAGLLTLLYNAVRFGSPFETGYLESESFSAFWPQGIRGELVSPGRGLLWYTPWILALIPAVPRAWRADRALTLLALGTALVHVLFYGKWYMWHGGFAWGPRFLLPVLPLLALLAAPLFAQAEAPAESRPARRRLGRHAFVLLGLTGVLVNLIGVAWDFMPHQSMLDAAGFKLFDPVTFFDPRWAQIGGMLALGSPATLDLIWVVNGQIVARMLLLSGALALVGLAVLWLALRQSRLPVLRVGLALMVIGSWLMLGDARAFQSRLDPVGQAYDTVVARLEETELPGAVIWHDDVEHAATFLNFYRGNLPILGLNESGADPSGEAATSAAPALTQAPRPVWLISDGPDRPQHALDLMLVEHKFPVLNETLGPVRLALYYDGMEWSGFLPASVVLETPRGSRIARLNGYRYTPNARPGGAAAVALEWEALQTIGEDYQVFVHLVPAGTPDLRVGQQDSAPAAGLRPTSTWAEGDIIEDRHALSVPKQTPPGVYMLRVGLYSLGDLTRLVAPGGQDAIEIGPIEVQATTAAQEIASIEPVLAPALLWLLSGTLLLASSLFLLFRWAGRLA
ncbi:MAG TPA: hypothetical protein VER55_02195 [Ardenticatenaceae bacterium]|nr:hypothetical protein [Ardenticatenaceae bacterium]